jgi:hypothetical protein
MMKKLGRDLCHLITRRSDFVIFLSRPKPERNHVLFVNIAGAALPISRGFHHRLPGPEV